MMSEKSKRPKKALRSPQEASIPEDQKGVDATCVASGAIAVPKSVSFPIIGIGASAGGLAAFEAFFSGMPTAPDPGMAIVLIQHLAPDHPSVLADLVARYTRMPVCQAEDGMTVKPNCVYVIPPNFDMALLNGALHLLPPASSRGQRLPIDFFFRSLAQDQHERAIGIVLSGTGSDGTQGVRAIKGEGGLVIVQSSATTEYDGMPRSALATGLVDYELDPAAMAAQIIAYVHHSFFKPGNPHSVKSAAVDATLNKIFILLRHQSGHDFSKYKPSTINRRIERRMAVHQIEKIETYVEYLNREPTEVNALFLDLLIGVTNFFRNPEAFKALEEKAFPLLFADKPADTGIRIWSPGCSTGEEPYSIAILLLEYLKTIKRNFKVQIFATDIDVKALAIARAGLYPTGIAADLSPTRLERFFKADPNGLGFRINESVRSMVLFSEQDLIRDPPFSKIDLISCRNVLIYMGGELQKQVIRLFHYALNPDGRLFLGNSESIGEFTDLFAALDRKSSVYQRKDALFPMQRIAMDWKMMHPKEKKATDPPRADLPAIQLKSSMREVTERALIELVTPAAVLVNGVGDVLYIHGRTGMYLEVPPGEVSIVNILKMAREGLGVELSLGLHKAVATRQCVERHGVRVKLNDRFTTIDLTISPVSNKISAGVHDSLFLIVMEEVPDLAPLPKDVAADKDVNAYIAALKRELQAREEFIRNSHEELESSTEELRASNEEMQSINEELQSSNEELETSKEELQSLSEELITVNTELETSVKNLERANNNARNLLSGTGIATIFVSLQQHIISFTPAITEVMNLIASDLGRPLDNFTSNLKNYKTLTEDVQEVLDTMVAKEIEVQTTNGRHYLLRIHLYRTSDNAIDGAVLNFLDITELKKAHVTIAEMRDVQDQLAHKSALLEQTGEVAKIGGWELDVSTGNLIWSLETYHIHEVDPDVPTAVAQSFNYFDPVTKAQLDAMVQAGIEHGTSWDDEVPMTTAKGRSIWVRVVGSALMENGKTIKLRGTIQDITARKLRDEQLLAANELRRLAIVLRDSSDAIIVQDFDGRISAWNPSAVRMYGWSEAEAMAMNIRELITMPQREEALTVIKQLSQAVLLEPYRLTRIAKDGRAVDVMITATALVNETGKMYAVATTERAVQSNEKLP